MMFDKDKYLVSIRCETYNQASYIEDTLRGFVMQQTDFPFVAVVVDDASTDGEQVVIRTFVDQHFKHTYESGFVQWETEDAYWTFAEHSKNENCHFVVVYLKRNLYLNPKKDEVIGAFFQSRYIAYCEGDDYWTDPFKLEKQVSFLEEHEEYTMCFTRAKVLLESNCPIYINCFDTINREYSATELFMNWIVPTPTLVFRKTIENYPIKHSEWILNSDIVMVEQSAHMGKVRGMSDCTAVYRIQNHGVTYDPFRKKEEIMRYPLHVECLKENFPLISTPVINEILGGRYFKRAMIRESKEERRKDLLKAKEYVPQMVRNYYRSKRKRLPKRVLKKINILFKQWFSVENSKTGIL